MVSVPCRAVEPGFAATAYRTVPFPLPNAPAVTLIQAALLVAVHEQPLVVVTATVAVVPASETEIEVADRAYSQGGGGGGGGGGLPPPPPPPLQAIAEAMASTGRKA
jgi:hypothetical protein